MLTTKTATTFYVSRPCYTEAHVADCIAWALQRAIWRNAGGVGPKARDCYWVEMTECGRIVARQGWRFPSAGIALDGDLNIDHAVFRTINAGAYAIKYGVTR